jgi:hypothetical protein
MNGLSSDNLQKLIEIMRKELEYAKGDPDASAEIAIEDIMLALVDMMASPADSQSTRPDRIGDECWYESRICDFINGSSHWSSKWQRGVLRCWDHSSSNCIAMVEDCETHDIIATANLCFAAEDPNKPAKKPQD